MSPALGDVAGDRFVFDKEGAEEWASLAGGNKVKVFIFTPVPINAPEEWIFPPGTLRYSAYIYKLKEKLKEMIPGGNTVIQGYPMDYQMDESSILWNLKNTPRGKVFVQYDNAHKTVKETKNVNGQLVECDVMWSKLRVFHGFDEVPM